MPKNPRNLFLRGNTWYYNFYLQGERFQGRIGQVSKTVAKEKLIRIKAQAYEGKFMPGKTRDESFSKVLDEYLAYCKDHQKKSTYQAHHSRANRLRRDFGALRLSQITPFRIEKYKHKRKSTDCAPATINREMAFLRHLFNRAMDWGYARTNPVEKVKFFRENNERTRYLTVEEKSRYLAACNPYFANLVTAARHTDCRASELLSLTWDNVSLERNQIVVTAAYAKNGQTRAIPMSLTLRSLLVDLKSKAQKGINSIFLNRDGRPYRSYRTAHKTTVRKAEIEDFTFHDWRHGFASSLAMAGKSLATIAELLGHKDIKMTRRYSHISEDHKQQAVRILDKIEDQVTTNLTTTPSEEALPFSRNLLQNNTMRP